VTTNGPQAIKPAGRPVVCLGLTKRWSLYVASHGNSRVRDWRKAKFPRTNTSARPTRCVHPYSPASVRAVASSRSYCRSASEAPLRATSSKSQPPHLVLDSHNYCHIQNLSFDHLLSGVIADYYEIGVCVNVKGDTGSALTLC